jgi:molybdenum cofactor guanylyltransferase
MDAGDRCGMKLSAVLLAGGASRRMGRDKATLEFSGRTLWRIQLDLLRKLQPQEIFVSARTAPPWRPVDVQLVLDTPPSRGPISGVAATLTQMRGTHLLVLAIDMPFMNERWLRFLCGQTETGCGTIPIIGDRLEPLVAIYPAEARPDLAEALRGTEFSLQILARRLVDRSKLRLVPVAKSDEDLFRNLNQPDDLAAARDALRG